ncbi:MAG: hypothetical protein H6811_12380, partial [Phycisphaeraceae bacterium]|nr:hypothetical protein [Phycisphaeraceae bacterium]
MPTCQVDDLASPGVEDAETGTVIGRTFQNTQRPGYWWRAYDWSNYVVTCFRCNSTWKKCLFPLATGPRTAKPDRGADERALLLDPYVEPGSDADPVRHLRFQDGRAAPDDPAPRGVPGQVVGETEEGRETIRSCGLDRPSLVDARSRVARD